MKIKACKLIIRLTVLIAITFSTPLLENSATAATPGRHFFCPHKTQHYYEEIYCEILQVAPSSKLPSARDFRHNTPRIQKLIVKPLAKKFGVSFDTHKANKDTSTAKKRPKNLPPYRKKTVIGKIINEKKPVACKLKLSKISCTDQTHFILAINKENTKIKKGLFDDANQMGLKEYQGDRENKKNLSLYMTLQYKQYLEKMLSIGLGGTTLTYNKFVDIFYITQQSSNRFSDRFETMYSTLKKDKASLGTPKSAPISKNLTIKQCQQISDRLFTCDDQRKNYVFVRP